MGGWKKILERLSEAGLCRSYGLWWRFSFLLWGYWGFWAARGIIRCTFSEDDSARYIEILVNKNNEKFYIAK